MAELQDDMVMEDIGDFQEDPKPKLSDSHKRKLDSIIVQMDEQGATKDEILAIVEDYKKRYSTKPLIGQPARKESAPGREMESVFGGKQPTFGAASVGASDKIVAVTENKPGQIAPIVSRPKAISSAVKAQKKLQDELHANDDVVETMIRNQRMNVAGQKFDAPTSEVQATGMREFQEPSVGVNEQPVTPDEIAMAKSDIEANEGAARNLFKEVEDRKPEKRKEIQKSVYLVDAVRSVQGNDERFEKIEKNAKGIENGELIYDVRSGQLIKPQGVVGSLLTGWKQKSQLFDDYSFFNNKSDDEIIGELERRRTDFDPDEPIPLPRHRAGDLAQMVGSMPLKPIVAGAAVSAVASPLAGAAAAGGIGAVDFYKMGYAGTLQNVYYQMREEGKSEAEALQIARTQAKKEAAVDAAVGGAMSVAGMRIGARPLQFSQGYRQAAISFLKSAGKEGAIQGAVGGGGELTKNLLAQDAGIKRETDAHVFESIASNFFLTVGMGAAAKLGKGISQVKYRSLLNGLKKVPDNVLEANIASELQAGRITEKQAENIRTEIKSYKELDSQIPDNVAEEARIEIQKKIERRTELENEMETKNKAFHPEIKEKIAKIDEEIVELSKQKEPKEKEAPEIKDAQLLIDEALEEGVMTDVYGAMAKENPEGFMKFVADQSFGRTDEGTIHGLGNTESQMRLEFGDAIVDKAKEMFPMEAGNPQPKVYSLGDNVEVEEKTYENTNYQEIRIGVKGIGEIVLGKEHGSENYKVDSVWTDKNVRGKGMAKELYYEAIKLLNSKGLDLEPGGYSSPEAVSVWKRLEREGLATIDSIVEGGEEPGMFIVKAKTTGKSKAETETKTGGSSDPNWTYGKREAEAETPPTEAKPEMIGITHEAMDNVAKELNLPTYEGDPETVAGWDTEARARMQKDPDAINKLTNKLRNGTPPDAPETRMMIMHMADLKAKYNKNPTPELLNEIKRTKDLYNITGREQGKAFRARQGEVPVEESLADFHMRDVEYNKGAPLTEQQLAQSTKEFQEIKAAKDALEAKVAKLEADAVRKKSEEKIKKEQSTAKKSETKDYKAERQQIIDDIRKKWNDSKGQASATFVPYAEQLVKIAPDVARLVRNVVEEGVTKLPDVIRAVHEQVKGIIPHITEKDIHNIIAGEYTSKKKKSEVAERLYDLREQAKLINKLEALQSGVQPKSEKQRVRRNQEIEDLRKKIKELQGDNKTDAEKIASIKTRIKSEINKLEDQLRKGDFEPEEKKPVELDDEAIKLKDELVELRRLREYRLQKQEYEQQSTIKKVWDYWGRGILGLRRGVGTSIDFSVGLRQALPVSINPRYARETGRAFKEMFAQWADKKRYSRWWDDLNQSGELKKMQDDGLPLTPPDQLGVTKREEEFRARLVQDIPGLGKAVEMSNQAASGFLNTMRVDLYRKFSAILKDKGITRENNPEAYEKMAHHIGDLTGRGELLKSLKSAEGLMGDIFFGPRLMAAKFNLLNPMRYAELPPEIRKRALWDLAIRAGMYTTIGALVKASGWSVSLDPNDPNFLKLKNGDTKYDMTGGEAVYIRTFLRIMNAAYDRVTGDEKDSMKTASKASRSTLSFFRNKLAPNNAYLVDALTGKKATGEDFDATDILRIYPMWIDDIVDDWKQDGAASILTAGVPSIFGIGVQTYVPKEQKEPGSKRSGRTKRPKRPTRK